MPAPFHPRRPAPLILLLSAALACAPMPGRAQGGGKVAKPAQGTPAPAGAAAPAAPPVALPEPPTPVKQAREIGLGQCAPVLDLMSRQTLTTTYDVQSGWSRTDPTHHVFQTVAALNSPKNVPPDGLAALVAAPMSTGGCDGVAMQVFPLAGDCQSAQKAMLKDGRLLGPMLNTRIMLDARGNRVILLPAYHDTCIAVSVETRFGTSP